MWNEIAIGAIGVVIGAALAPLAKRFFPVPGRMARVRREVERAWVDHSTWVERRERQMRQAMGLVDEDAAARGIVGSSIQVAGHRRAQSLYVEDVRDHQVATIRATEDAFAELGTVEVLWMRLTLRHDRGVPVERRLVPRSERIVEDDDHMP